MGDNSNYTVSKKCPGGSTSSNCVTWVGKSIPCLGICKWDTLTEVQFAVATKVCELAQVLVTDVAAIVLPECFLTVWQTDWADQEETVVNFLSFILDELCNQYRSIELINTKLLSIGTDATTQINPIVDVNFCCCGTTSCDPTVPVTLTEAFTTILTCICNLKSTVGTPPNGFTVVSYIDSIKTLVNAQNATISNMQTTINGINGTTIPNINSKLCILKDAVNHLIAGTPATTITFTC
tara:strand:+ start:15925 stop:16638 length:714 start_codon:yes stop_codon:yes gene_type:complete